MARIVAGEKLDDLADCDLVIETAVEKEEVKRKIFHELCAVLKPEAIVASDTSSISITRLAAATDRPERFIGIHFMNPVPLMELVELIRGIATDDHTFEASKEFVAKLGKQVAVSEDFPAFIVNRILLPMINEAIYTLYEGVGNVEAIDAAMKLGGASSDGPAGARRFHWPRYLSVHHAGAARGSRRLQISSVPAAGEIRRGGLARPQDPARLLRLPRR
ncbi:3-hydroxyacyl-CoA dehydrogenase [Bradyrhizobium sp. LB7.2]